MKNLTWQNPGQLFVAQELIKIVKLKCCGIKVFIFGLKDLFKLLIRLIIIVFRKKYYLSPDTELFHSINEAKNYKERGDECFDSYFWSESRRCRLLSFGFEIVKVEVYDEEDVESYGGIREEPKRYYVFTKKLKSSKK